MPAGGPHAPDDTMGALTFRATLVMTSGRMHLEDLTITESTVKSPALDSCLRDTLERSAESLADRGAGDARLAMEDTIRIGDLTALAARPPSPGTAKP